MLTRWAGGARFLRSGHNLKPSACMLVGAMQLGIMYMLKLPCLPLSDRIRTAAVYRSDAALYHADLM